MTGRALGLAFAGLLTANVALALGPWLVRLSDTGPVAAGFWRLALALPFLVLLARRETGAMPRLPRATVWPVAAAAVFFALDLASWHIGIERTRLGNAALFGNAGSVILVAFGLIAARRMPHALELGAVAAAIAGAALLMGGSLEIGPRYLVGDLFCLVAGVLYAGYILMLRPARGAKIGQWTLLAWTGAIGAPVLLGISLFLGETVMPRDWTPLIALMLGSQLIGQGLLIWALAHFRPLVIGLALLTQPAVAALAGWLAFGETVSALDTLGMVLLAGALVLARVAEPRAVRAVAPTGRETA